VTAGESLNNDGQTEVVPVQELFKSPSYGVRPVRSVRIKVKVKVKV